jgi:hypothetical protein
LKLVNSSFELVDVLLVGTVLRIDFFVQLGFLGEHILHFGEVALKHFKFGLVVQL